MNYIGDVDWGLLSARIEAVSPEFGDLGASKRGVWSFSGIPRKQVKPLNARARTMSGKPEMRPNLGKG
jgi:hypothetical protein